MKILTDLLKNIISIVSGFFIGKEYVNKKSAQRRLKGMQEIANKWANARNESTSDRLRRIAKKRADS